MYNFGNKSNIFLVKKQSEPRQNDCGSIRHHGVLLEEQKLTAKTAPTEKQSDFRPFRTKKHLHPHLCHSGSGSG